MKKLFPFLAIGVLTANVAHGELQRVSYVQPEGEVRTYHGFSHSSYLSPVFSIPVTEDHDGLARKVIFADNGDVWFKDPISRIKKDAWIKGHMEGNIITIELPIIYANEGQNDEDAYQITRLVRGAVTGEDGSQTVTWVPDKSKSVIQFEYTEDDRILQVNEGMAVMMGLVEDDSYMYFGDYGIEYTRVSGSPVVFPTDVEPELWTFKCFWDGDYAVRVEVAEDGNDFYMRGFWPDWSGSAIKGEIEGDKVIFRPRQYMGFMSLDTGFDYYVYLVTGHKEPSIVTFNYVTDNNDLVFAYDKEAKTLTPLFDENTCLMVTKGMTTGSSSDVGNTYVAFSDMSMKVLNEIKAIPDINVTDCFQYLDTGWGQIEFELPPYDEEQNALLPEKLFYSIYHDDHVLTIDPEDAFEPDQYEGIDKPWTEIPYTFDNDYGIKSRGSKKNRSVAFFRLADERVGVQAMYYDDLSGEKIYSNVTFVDLNSFERTVVKWEDMPNNPANGVESVVEGNVVDVKCYDISGRRVSDSYKGLMIVEKTLDNGKREVVKRMAR